MSKPHKCPVCDGTGLVSRPPHIAGDVISWSDAGAGPYQCRACRGTGVVWEFTLDLFTIGPAIVGEEKGNG